LRLPERLFTQAVGSRALIEQRRILALGAIRTGSPMPRSMRE